MPCHGSLRKPLWDTIKAIGCPAHATICSTAAYHTSIPSVDLSTTINTNHKERHERRRSTFARSSRYDSQSRPWSRDENLATRGARWMKVRQYTTSATAAQSDTSDGDAVTEFLDDIEEQRSPSSEQCVSPDETSSNQDWAPVMKEGDEFHDRYYQARHNAILLKQKAAARTKSQFKQRDEGLWRRIFNSLDRASPSGAKHWGKQSELVTLSRGVHASFDGDHGAAILDIMQRTGCHVQVPQQHALYDRSASFTGLMLKGTRMQIRDALSIIPSMVCIVQDGKVIEDKTVNQYQLRSKIGKASDDASEMLQPGKQTTASLADAESASDSVVEDDIFAESDATTESATFTEPEPIAETGRQDTDLQAVRSVWAKERLRKSPVALLETTHSSFKTSSDLTAYVSDLIGGVPRAKLRKTFKDSLPDATKQRFDPIATKLVSLMLDASARPLITAEALTKTWQYLVKTKNIAAVRAIYSELDQAGFAFRSSSLEVLLVAAAKAGDLHNFDYVMTLLNGKKIQPTARMWAAFHELTWHGARSHADEVVATMRDKHIFRDSMALLAVLKITAKSQMVAHVAKDGDMESFFRAQDRRMDTTFGRMGFNWLQIDVVNTMLNLLLTLGRTGETRALLKKFSQEGLNGGAANTTTMNMFLTVALRDRDPAVAVATMKWCRVGQPGALVPNEATYKILFSIAWHRRCYNMLRVIWCYGCASGHVPRYMQKRLRETVPFYLPELKEGEFLSRGQIWLAWAGKFAIGIEKDLWPTDQTRSILSSGTKTTYHARLIEYATQQKKLQPGSTESMSRFNTITGTFEADLDEVGSSKPTEPLAEILEQALQKDLVWKARGIGMPKGLAGRDLNEVFTEMLENGIKVPMRPGDFTRENRPWQVPDVLHRATAREGVEHPAENMGDHATGSTIHVPQGSCDSATDSNSYKPFGS